MMRRFFILLMILVAAALAIGGGENSPRPVYSVAAVKGKLLREEPAPEERLRVGADIAAGSVLRTGWRSSAEIVSLEAGARFVIDPRTRVRMASNQPGVLLEMQKGRLRAVFDKVSEGPSAERIVTTPSAVLAVRGTEYGVAVSSAGDTSVVVFSGVVEVTDVGRAAPPVAVAAGQYCDIPKGNGPGLPMQHSMGPGDWDHGHMPGSMSGRDSGSMMGGHGSGHSRGGGTMGHGG